MRARKGVAIKKSRAAEIVRMSEEKCGRLRVRAAEYLLDTCCYKPGGRGTRHECCSQPELSLASSARGS